MTSYSLDLTVPEQAYIFGFIQADGHLAQMTRNRGKLQVELRESDAALLYEIAKVLPFPCSVTSRVRRTNFADEYKSAMLRVYDRRFRDALLAAGMPYGNKSQSVSLPIQPFSVVDYFRGWVDADGSLGITSNGFPFLSLITASHHLATAYLSFIREATGKSKLTSRNRRDQVYNIAIYKEDAQSVVATLYYEGCLALARKMESARKVVCWVRPESMRKVDFERKRWTPKDDSYILEHTIEDSAVVLQRTPKSIKMRLWRLRG